MCWRNAGRASTTRYLHTVGQSTDTINGYGSITKVLRLLLQSVMLGAGAYLVLRTSYFRRHDRRLDHDEPGARAD